ncbi:MAG TPA: hypothetical protein VFF65_01900, partial [Phycisphaerales bacterium]|nr:hypothetical protein [Phycisphaerales bacterium]
RGVSARVIRQGTRLSLTELLAGPPPRPSLRPAGPATEIPVVEPGQNRQLASWRFFCRASQTGSGVSILPLDGWRLIGWPDGRGGAAFEIEPLTRP